EHKIKYRVSKISCQNKKIQGSHIFISLLATVKLEWLSLKKGLSTFSLKTKLYIKAQKGAIEALRLVQVSTA
ncbi:MAG: hypothetical protein KAH18_12715, partial [Psychromonas sp.]|nr:hypothetical protein [Psychromonas sp.]